MKKIIVFTCFMLIYSAAFTQKRVSKQNLEYNEKIGDLKRAIGWEYNSSTGDWVDYQNYIDSNTEWKSKDSNKASSLVMSYDEQNFIDLNFKKIVYKDKSYFVLLVKKWGGRYKYPNIREDWIKFIYLKGYIFNEKKYNELKTFNEQIDLTTVMNFSTIIENDYNQKDELDRIQYVLDKEEWSEYATEYLFPVRVSKKGKIRFLIPFMKSSYKENYDFEKYYFEIKRAKWNNLIGKV